MRFVFKGFCITHGVQSIRRHKQKNDVIIEKTFVLIILRKFEEFFLIVKIILRKNYSFYHADNKTENPINYIN